MKTNLTLFLMLIWAISPAQSLWNLNTCSGTIASYNYSFPNAVTYQWTVSSGNTNGFSGNSIIVAWSSTAVALGNSLSVTAYDQNGVAIPGSTHQETGTIDPYPQPFITANFNSGCVQYEGDPNHTTPQLLRHECYTACQGNEVEYSTIANGGSYQWMVYGGTVTSSINSQQVTVNWNSRGLKTLSVTVTSPAGCSSTTDTCVVVIDKPDALFTCYPQPDSKPVAHICKNQDLYFKNLSYAYFMSPIIGQVWNFGDGTFSSVFEPVHHWGVAGTYRVSLTVTNQCQCTDTYYMEVMVDEGNTIAIECPSTVCPGDIRSYNVDATCTPTYDWSVIGGTILSPQPFGNTIQVQWGNSSPGVVTFTPTDCGAGFCKYPISILIPIISPGGTIQGQGRVCYNSQTPYTIPAIPGATYNWSIIPLSAGTIMSGQTTNEIFIQWAANAFDGNIHVDYVSDWLSCKGSGDLGFKLRSEFVLTGPDEICDGSALTMYASGINGGNYRCDITRVSNNHTVQVVNTTNGTINIPTWNNGTGFFVIEVYNYNNYCEKEIHTLNVVSVPSAISPSAFSGPLVVCPDNTYNYHCVNSDPDLILQWTITGGTPTTGIGEDLGIKWNSAGPYIIEVRQITSSGIGCQSLPLVVNLNPKIPFTSNLAIEAESYININDIDPSNYQICNNMQANYTCVSTNIPTSNPSGMNIYDIADNYVWSVTSSTGNSIYGSVVSGQGTAQVEIQWNNATTTTAQIDLNVFSCGTLIAHVTKNVIVGASNVSIIGPTSACWNTPITFLPDNYDASSTYSWNFGDLATTSTHDYSVTHTYTYHANPIATIPVNLIVTSADGCISNATPLLINFTGVQPTLSISYSLPLQTPANCFLAEPAITINASPAGPAYTYQWTMGPLFTSIIGTTNTYYTSATGFGAYQVTVTDPGTQCSTIKTISVVGCNSCINYPGVSVPTVSYIPQNCSTYVFTCHYTGYPTNASVNWSTSAFSGVSFSSLTGNSVTVTFSEPFNLVIIKAVLVIPGYCDIPLQAELTVPYIAGFYTELSCGNGVYDVTLTSNTPVVPLNNYSYSWIIDHGAPISGNPITLSLTGAHDVELTISNSSLPICSQNVTLQLGDFPTVTSINWVATLPHHPRCVETPVEFTAITTGNIAKWDWLFGDLSELIQYHVPPAIRTYTAPSLSYPVNLIVTDKFGCTASLTQPITIVPNVLNGIINPDPGPGIICKGGNGISFTPILGNPPLPIYSGFWSTQNGSRVTSFNLTGMYHYNLVSEHGCTFKTSPYNVIANGPPLPVIKGKLEFCEGENVLLNGNYGTYNYQWKLNGNIIGGNTSSINLGSTLSAGNYTIDLTSTGNYSNGPCSNMTTTTIIVHPKPVITIITNSPMPSCENNTVTLQIDQFSGGQINWSTGETATNITVNLPGPYNAAVTDEFGCVAESNAITLEKKPDFNFLPSGCYELCNTIPINIPGINHHYAYYEWTTMYNGSIYTPGSNITGSGFVPALSLGTLAPGVYNITLSLTTDMGCDAISNPIELIISDCNCSCFSLESVSLDCIFNDAYHQAAGYNVNCDIHACETGFYTITVPEGNITPNSGSVLFNSNNPYNGILRDLPPTNQSEICMNFNFTVSNHPELNCNINYCKAPFCNEFSNCSLFVDIRIANIVCIGSHQFEVTLSVYNPYGYDLLVYFDTQQGTLQNNPVSIAPGSSTFTFNFTDVIPYNHYLTISYSIYNPVTGERCWYETPAVEYHYFLGCDLIDRFSSENTVRDHLQDGFEVLPNPAQTTVTVKWHTGKLSNLLLKNTIGQTIFQLPVESNGKYTFNVENLQQGLYLWVMKSSDGLEQRQKFIINH